MFSADGNYSRVSQVNGKTYHSDSGAFRLEPPDKLVLSIQVTGQKTSRKIQTPALEKTHKYSLSPDGDELRLTSEKGTTDGPRRRPASVPLVAEQVPAAGMDDLRGWADRYLEAVGGSGVVAVADDANFVIKVSKDLAGAHPVVERRCRRALDGRAEAADACGDECTFARPSRPARGPS